MYKFLLFLLLTCLFTVSAAADVITGPAFAIYIGGMVLIPVLLIALVMFITARLIRWIHKNKKRHEED